MSDIEIKEHVSNLVSDNYSSIGSKLNQHPNITHIDFKPNQLKDTADVLYEQAIDFIRETKKASTTSLQNKFKIGYQKAAGIIDRLEADGVIGKRIKVNEPREVLI